MTNMSNNVEQSNYTRKYSHNHAKLRAAMKYHGVTVKDLAKIIKRDPRTVERRLNGQGSFGMLEVIAIYDALGLNRVDDYFSPPREKGVHAAVTDDKSIVYKPADAWEIPHGAEIVAYRGEEIITGVLIHACYPPVVKVGEEYLEIKPGEQDKRVIVLGQVVAMS